MIWRSLTALLFLILAFGSTLWFSDYQTEAPAERETRSPDYELEDAEISAMDAAGRQKYRLQAPHMEHYLDLNRAYVDRPTLWYYRQADNPIRMQADDAEIINNGTLIHLTGKVNLHRPAFGESTEFTLDTTDVWVRMTEKTATTNKPVTAVSERYTITGLGASVSLESDLFLIHSKAESVYEPL